MDRLRTSEAIEIKHSDKMNEYQLFIAEALAVYDISEAMSGNPSPVVLKFFNRGEEYALEDYMERSDKWTECEEGFTTGKIVYTLDSRRRKKSTIHRTTRGKARDNTIVKSRRVLKLKHTVQQPVKEVVTATTIVRTKPVKKTIAERIERFRDVLDEFREERRRESLIEFAEGKAKNLANLHAKVEKLEAKEQTDSVKVQITSLRKSITAIKAIELVYD